MIAVLLRYLLCCALLFIGLVQAASLEVMAAEWQSLASAFEYFLDAGGQMDLAEASIDRRYQRMTGDGLALGFRSEVLWGRVTLHNPAAVAVERRLSIQQERLEQVSLFVPEASGGYRRLENGLQIAVDRRPVQSRVIAFPVRIEARASATLYLRVHTRSRMSLLPILWTPAAFERTFHQEELLAMLSFGVLLGLALYALALVPFQRDRAALYLGLNLIFICLGEASLLGYDHAYLWPERPYWSFQAPPVFGLLALMSMNRLIANLIPFDNMGSHRGRRGMEGLLLVQGGILAAVLLGPAFPVFLPGISPLMMVSKIAYLGVTLRAMRQGFPPARLMLISLSVAFLAGMPIFAELLGWAPDWRLAPQASMALLSFVCALLFIAAISQRLDKLKREKLAAQAEILVAQRADLAKGEFLARVSHELRTPLHLILGYAHLLRRDSIGVSGRRLALLEEGGQHLARLVDDLLDYARGERGGVVLDAKAVFVYSLLERIKAYGVALAHQHQHVFESHFAENLPAMLRLDAQRLEQVVLILLSNAALHTRQGRIRLSVGLSAMETGRVCFAVEDSGAGIDAANLERIFEPFERAADGQHKGGLGLGLAIARQTVRAMGGDLGAESRPGQGSRFFFDIPRVLAVEADLPATLSNANLFGYRGPSRSILVLEDHAANRHLLTQLLTEAGFVVQGVDSVQASLAWLGSGSCDLALLDQRLEDGTAWEVLRVMRGDARHRPIPVVLLSAQPPRPPPDWGDAPGFDAVLLKPAGGAEILSCIGKLLGLEWQGEAQQAVAPVGAAQALPSTAECAELAEYVRQGSIYESEAWLEALRAARPEYAEFCRDVAASLDALDFPAIATRLACLEA